MFFRRSAPDGPDRWLRAKVWVFLVGAALALLGMGLGNDWIVAAAAAVLAVGIGLRFAGARDPENEP